MNASPHHSKVKVSLTLANPIFVAGSHVSGKMEMECRADSGLGINVMMVELFAIQGQSYPSGAMLLSEKAIQSSRLEIILRRLHSCIAAVYFKVQVFRLRMLFMFIHFLETLLFPQTITKLAVVYLHFYSVSPSLPRRLHQLFLAQVLHG